MYRRQPTIHPLSKLVHVGKGTMILLLAALVLSGCALLPQEGTALQPPLVQPIQEKLDVVDVTRGDIQTFLKGTATFVAANEKALSFKDGGQLKSVHVTLGQEVKAGELLAELETGDLQLQVDMQKLSVERAQLLYTQAKADGASPIDLRLREIDLKREKMTLNSIESRYEKSRLYAPITGKVIFIESLKAGDHLNAYQSVISVADASTMQLTYVAAESKDVAPIEAGMPVSLKYKGKDYTGKVLQSPSNVPVGGDSTKTESNAVKIVMGMDHPPDGIQIGHSAEFTIGLQKSENAIVLPRSAIRSYMGRFYVQISDGERRKEVDIEVGLTTPTEVEIVKGLTEGQKVILNN